MNPIEVRYFSQGPTESAKQIGFEPVREAPETLSLDIWLWKGRR